MPVCRSVLRLSVVAVNVVALTSVAFRQALRPYRLKTVLAEIQWAVRAEFRLTECFQMMSKAMGERQQHAVMRHIRKLQRTAHFEIKAITNHHKRYIVQRVVVTLAEFVAPQDYCVVQ